MAVDNAMTDPKKAVAPSPFASSVGCTEGHELILQAFASNGVRKLFFCGGTDNFHLMESVARFKAAGRPAPDLVTVLHEASALYMNMGYFQWTRQPQVTVLHVDSGTLNAGAAWSEAWQAGAGIVADSDPAREYEETVSKLGALAQALQMAEEAAQPMGGAA